MASQDELRAFALACDPGIAKLPEAFQFGDSPEMADELAALVLTGRKTATTSWPLDPSITEGTLNIVLDGRGDPAALIRTVKVEHVPFLEVAEDFAAAEGEGDLSLEHWRREHRAFFTRVAPSYGREFTDAELVQCEAFEVVHPK